MFVFESSQFDAAQIPIRNEKKTENAFFIIAYEHCQYSCAEYVIAE